MSDDPSKEFEAERDRQAGRLDAIEAKTRAEVGKLLGEAEAEIRTILAGQPSDYQQWVLPHLEASIRQSMADVAGGMVDAATDGVSSAWGAGVDLVDRPVAAALGLELHSLLPSVDTRQLMAMRTFMTGKMKEVAAEALARINSELGMVMVGIRAPSDAVGAITDILGEKARGRAFTILRTETGRAYSTAQQERQSQAVKVLPGLRKLWRRSTKRHSRVSHDHADGQIVEVDKPFLVGGTAIMYPRDPAAPAKHTINCGCLSLPHMADWEVKHPIDKPYSADELAASPIKRRMDDMRVQSFDGWARKLDAGTLKPTGSVETVGSIPSDLVKVLDLRGAGPVSTEIAVTDRQVRHMLRSAKKDAGKALPSAMVRRLPGHLSAPKAVLWDLNAKVPKLVYVLDVPGSDKLAKVVVKIRDTDTRARHRRHNFVVTSGLVGRADLANEKAYQVLSGAL